MKIRSYFASAILPVAFGLVLGEFLMTRMFVLYQPAMGRAFPGQFPRALRIEAIVQAVFLLALAVVVLARAGVILPGWSRVSRWLIWFIVAFAALSLVLNLITPGAGERAIWVPVTFLLLISSGSVALTRNFERAAR